MTRWDFTGLLALLAVSCSQPQPPVAPGATLTPAPLVRAPQPTLTPSQPLSLETRPLRKLGTASSQAHQSLLLTRWVPTTPKVTARPPQPRPSLPAEHPVPSRVSPKPSASPGPAPDEPVAIKVVPPSPLPTPADDGPIEVEVVPPKDPALLQQLPTPPPDNPQAVLATPMAVHFGYSYSRSLSNLVRDGQLRLQIMGTGYTGISIRMNLKGNRPLHGYFFPGMVFKPERTTQYAPIIIADLQEFFLYPDSPQVFRLQGYSLDRKKPLPEEQFPVPYRLEPERDPRYPAALRTLQALLERESDPVKFSQSPTYQNHRFTIVQLGLWRATSGRYRADQEVARLIGGINPADFPKLRDAIYAEVDALERHSNRL